MSVGRALFNPRGQQRRGTARAGLAPKDRSCKLAVAFSDELASTACTASLGLGGRRQSRLGQASASAAMASGKLTSPTPRSSTSGLGRRNVSMMQSGGGGGFGDPMGRDPRARARTPRVTSVPPLRSTFTASCSTSGGGVRHPRHAAHRKGKAPARPRTRLSKLSPLNVHATIYCEATMAKARGASAGMAHLA